jgi:hypothetical protein
MYDRSLNSILFQAAWGALSEVLGIDEHELAAIFTVQTAGEALNQPLPGAASWRSQVRGWKYLILTFTGSWLTAIGTTAYLPGSLR